MTYDQLKEQLAVIFSLYGGELSDAPLRYATIVRGESYVDRRWVQTARFRRSWLRYFYDGLPEWCERDYRNLSGSFITVLWDRGDYGDHTPPQHIYARGRRWRRLAVLSDGGEAECPGRTLHECQGHEGTPTKDGVALVTRRSAKLTPRIPWDLSRGPRPTWYRRRAECPLCEERIGQPHGYVYNGEGWCSVIYRARD